MILRALMTAGLLLALAGSASAADECTRTISKVKEALSEPQKLETIHADVSSDIVRRAVGLFIEQAQADHVAGNDKTCVTRLVAAKKILDME